MDRQELLEQLVLLGNKYPGHLNMPMEAQYLLGCRSFPQFCSTFRTIAEPETFCVFCNPELAKSQPEMQTDRWYLKKNDFPVKGTSLSLLIIPRRHMVPGDNTFTRVDGEVFELFERAKRNYDLKGAGLMMRFGDPHFHAGTVPHLHINLLVPTGTEECKPPLGKSEENWAQDYARLLEHIEELEAKGGLAWLFSPEGVEATKQ